MKKFNNLTQNESPHREFGANDENGIGRCLLQKESRLEIELVDQGTRYKFLLKTDAKIKRAHLLAMGNRFAGAR